MIIQEAAKGAGRGGEHPLPVWAIIAGVLLAINHKRTRSFYAR
jgi:hypothetical protein